MAAAKRVYHAALASEWEAAQASGSYEISSLGLTLAEVGFIHASFARQVPGVLKRYYQDVEGPLVVLHLDVRKLGQRLRVEALGSREEFPHVYGPIEPDDVVAVDVVERQEGNPRWVWSR